MTKLGMFRLAPCVLYLLCSQERERKEKIHSSFFLFTATCLRGPMLMGGRSESSARAPCPPSFLSRWESDIGVTRWDGIYRETGWSRLKHLGALEQAGLESDLCSEVHRGCPRLRALCSTWGTGVQ